MNWSRQHLDLSFESRYQNDSHVPGAGDPSSYIYSKSVCYSRGMLRFGDRWGAMRGISFLNSTQRRLSSRLAPETIFVSSMQQGSVYSPTSCWSQKELHFAGRHPLQRDWRQSCHRMREKRLGHSKELEEEKNRTVEQRLPAGRHRDIRHDRLSRTTGTERQQQEKRLLHQVEQRTNSTTEESSPKIGREARRDPERMSPTTRSAKMPTSSVIRGYNAQALVDGKRTTG